MGFGRLYDNRAYILTALVLACALKASCALAQEAPPSRDALMDIAKQFVEKVGGNLKNADVMMAEHVTPEDMRMQKYFDALPDGEILVMQINLQSPKKREYNKLNLEQPVIGLKEGHDVLVSLLDFVSAANFPIKLTPERGQAKGWFIRESNTFDLDLGQVSLMIGGKPVPIEPGDVQFGDEDIMIKARTLARWFGFQVQINPRSQQIKVVTPQKWPIQEKIDRAKRFNSKRKQAKPSQPFVESDYRLASLPNLNVALRGGYKKSPALPGEFDSSYNIQGRGDLAGHLATLTATGNEEHSLDSVFLNFRRESPDADLLGALKARLYEFNDITPTKVPLAGAAPTERGVRITNKNPFGTYDTTTLIEGYAPPGWDVELYRGTQYISGITVDENGIYSFDNVTLYAGDNKFRVIQYGPQGELREEEKLVTVTPSLYAENDGIYDVSLSQQNQQTYKADPPEDPDRNTPHLSATYERQVKPNLAVRTGIRARQQQENQIAYVHGGTVSVWKDAIINADALISTDATYMASLTGRRGFGLNNLFTTATYRSDGFVTDRAESPETPGILEARAQMRGPFTVTKGYRKFGGTYDTFASFFRRNTGNLGYGTGLTLSSGFRNFSYSNALSYFHETAGIAGVEDRDEVEGTLSFRGRVYNTGWRTNLSYDLMPDVQFTNFNANLNKSFSQTLEGELDVRRDFETRYMIETASLNWRLPKAIVSPSVSYDTDEVMTARVNVRFGLSYNPYDHDIVMDNKNLADKGGIAAFVFLDKGGDGLFTEGDEPLADVTVEATQVNREASSDAGGEAFISDLPTNRVTDVVMEESSAFDPNWSSAFKGVSVRPRAGEIVRIEFPVQRGAEMDGTAYVQDESGKRLEARNVTLNITAPDGKVVSTGETPYDGFYVISRIPPGVYYMTADTSLSPVTAFMRPKKLVITAEGGIMYGQDLTLYKNYDIPFMFRATNAAPTGKRGTRVVRPEDIESQEIFIRLGQYRSRLAMALAWYKFKLRSQPWSSHFMPVTPLSKIEADPQSLLMSLMLKPKNPLSIDQGAAVCEGLIDLGFACGVETVTTYRDFSKVTEEVEKPEEKADTVDKT